MQHCSVLIYWMPFSQPLFMNCDLEGLKGLVWPGHVKEPFFITLLCYDSISTMTFSQCIYLINSISLFCDKKKLRPLWILGLSNMNCNRPDFQKYVSMGHTVDFANKCSITKLFLLSEQFSRLSISRCKKYKKDQLSQIPTKVSSTCMYFHQ